LFSCLVSNNGLCEEVKELKAPKVELSKVVDTSDLVIRDAVWGDIHVEYGIFNKKLDITPFLKGLPDDLDQCPHWGYLFKGRFWVKYKDGREEVINAGDTYYIAPGHSGIVEAGTEYVEFSPAKEYSETMKVLQRNMALVQVQQ